MIEIKRIHIINTNKICFIDVNIKKIIFETTIEYKKTNEALIFETGLMYGLHKTGINFLFGPEKMSQEELDAFLK